MSVVGCGRPGARSSDTATIDEAWRLSVGNVYSGNTLAGAPAGGQPSQIRDTYPLPAALGFGTG